ncbi:hypothetical protein G6F45_014318 [Rhizopus arrhizus]|nr:hypothetical protein G6F45_014318 [Rhizopus arrhizus]
MARPRLPAACKAARTATLLEGRMGWSRALAADRWRLAAPAGRGVGVPGVAVKHAVAAAGCRGDDVSGAGPAV